MKRRLAAAIALSAGLGLALGAGPALAQQGGRIMMKPSAPAAKSSPGQPGNSAGRSTFKPTKPAGPPTAGQMGITQGPAGEPKSPGFNRNVKPLYGVGPKSTGRGR